MDPLLSLHSRFPSVARAEAVIASEMAGMAHPLDARVAAHSWDSIFVASALDVFHHRVHLPQKLIPFDFSDKNAFPQEFHVHGGKQAGDGGAGDSSAGTSTPGERGRRVHTVATPKEHIASLKYQSYSLDPVQQQGHLAVVTKHGNGTVYTVNAEGECAYAWSVQPPHRCEAGWAGVALSTTHSSQLVTARQLGFSLDLFDGER